MCSTKKRKKLLLCNFFGASNFLTVLHRKSYPKRSLLLLHKVGGWQPVLAFGISKRYCTYEVFNISKGLDCKCIGRYNYSLISALICDITYPTFRGHANIKIFDFWNFITEIDRINKVHAYIPKLEHSATLVLLALHYMPPPSILESKSLINCYLEFETFTGAHTSYKLYLSRIHKECENGLSLNVASVRLT